MESISNRTSKARKNHYCNAWEFIHEHKQNSSGIGYEDDGYKCKGIKVGDVYQSQFNRDCGDVWQFKGCISCLEYASKNDVDMTGDY